MNGWRIVILSGYALLLAVSQVVAASGAPAVRVHTVQQILLDGKDTMSAGATVTPRTGSPQPTIHRGETIALNNIRTVEEDLAHIHQMNTRNSLNTDTPRRSAY